MATASTMILSALRKIGEKEHAGTLSANEQTNYLSDLNSMLVSWSLERLMCYHILEESKALTASVGSYTIGSGGAWDTTRPTKIVSAFVRATDNSDTPLKVIQKPEYDAIVLKTTDGTYPEYLFYDASYPLGTIYLYPEPSSGLTLYINSWKQLQSFASISTDLALPPGYQRAIEFNLAIELAGGFTSVTPEVAKIARDSKAAIKGVNRPDVMMQIDGTMPAMSTRSNILTGI